jgi:glycopeptide antibiotics resistance protein
MSVRNVGAPLYQYTFMVIYSEAVTALILFYSFKHLFGLAKLDFEIYFHIILCY